MSLTHTLELDCHVRPGPDAVLTVTIDGVTKEFTLVPTINWVASSNNQGANSISTEVALTDIVSAFVKHNQPIKQQFDVKISCKNNDVLICGYRSPNSIFNIVTQPTWDDPAWHPYDISGHEGDNPQFAGPGSLEILDSQTVEFKGELTFYNPNSLPTT